MPRFAALFNLWDHSAKIGHKLLLLLSSSGKWRSLGQYGCYRFGDIPSCSLALSSAAPAAFPLSPACLTNSPLTNNMNYLYNYVNYLIIKLINCLTNTLWTSTCLHWNSGKNWALLFCSTVFLNLVINPVKHNIGSNHIIKKSIFKQYFWVIPSFLEKSFYKRKGFSLALRLLWNQF